VEGISDIKIIGIDEKRPPRIRREPYIDLFFRLSHKAPIDWCQDFASLQPRQDYTWKIDTDECLYIETWVRTPEEIAEQLQALKQAVAECNVHYIDKVQARERSRDGANANLQNDEGPQGQLNRIIAGLDYGE
jgi:hypothetical protein